ncbi:RNA methyltransferase [Nocardioides sp. Root190]|uniref:TfoX/Sxy family protein n=1 Tax=Nocardioides sp. Root190 TaxID=1736488 RepID=UPI0007010F61|nr:TfoX/Sxy family protein [Nocardioides sp. Root190]KRB73010.1 RNA methyltransferase [Nocardioides sp. Root190]
MAYDEVLAARIRDLVTGEETLDGHEVTEKKMFGGLGFLVGGHLAVAASGQGGLMVRIDPADSEDLLTSTSARPMEMRGREMSGWLRVDDADLRDEAGLASWVTRGTAYAASLPAK